MSSVVGWSGIGIDCPERWWIHHPWKFSEDTWMWPLGIWFRGEQGSAGSAGGLDDLEVFSNINDFMTL